jgi:alkyl hydroperoxide reductase subunit AhpC
MLQVGSQAPAWFGDAYKGGDFCTLRSSDLEGKWAILFFYPLDFTPI